MKALFIGRFQPFHKGHLRVIQDASENYDKIIIGIGSSQYSDTSDNPFSSKDRQTVIKKTLDELNITNYEIILIPDINDPPNWVDHVLSIISDFDVIITNNQFTKSLFIKKGYNVKETELFDKHIYSGCEIRRRINEEENWSELVPKPVYDYICKILKK